MSLFDGPRRDSNNDAQQLTEGNSASGNRISRKPVARSLVATLSSTASPHDGKSSQLTLNDTPSTSKAGPNIAQGEGLPNNSEPPATDQSERLIKEYSAPLPGEDKYVRWGIAWNYPSYMVLWMLAGLAWAPGHHFHYQSLDGTEAGSSSRQGWAVRFGTAFAFLVVSCLRAACDIAYKQYIWTLFKRKSFPLSVLDKLFSATSDPTAFVSWKLVRHAKVAFFVAVVCWSVRSLSLNVFLLTFIGVWPWPE